MYPFKILFVCTGNTCRSPMAAVMAGEVLRRAGLMVSIQSAGLSAFGEPASRHAAAAMEEEGLDLSKHLSRPVTEALLEESNLVLTMTRNHRNTLLKTYPKIKGKIYTLSEYATGTGRDISDPYGQDYAAYRMCAGQIKELLRLCVHKLKENFMDKLHVTNHPLVQSKITMLRSIETGNKEFRELVEEIAMLICYEATRDIPLTEIELETPICKTKGMISEQKFGIVPIMRAGLGMAQGISNLLPTAKIGHIGLYRDPESLHPVEYFCKLPPDCHEREILLLDPMLATGRTAGQAIGYLKERGVSGIKFLCLVAAPEGVAHIQKEHPDVRIYTAAYDERLNDKGYIVPGLGDAGDRLFGTK